MVLLSLCVCMAIYNAALVVLCLNFVYINKVVLPDNQIYHFIATVHIVCKLRMSLTGYLPACFFINAP